MTVRNRWFVLPVETLQCFNLGLFKSSVKSCEIIDRVVLVSSDGLLRHKLNKSGKVLILDDIREDDGLNLETIPFRIGEGTPLGPVYQLILTIGQTMLTTKVAAIVVVIVVVAATVVVIVIIVVIIVGC